MTGTSPVMTALGSSDFGRPYGLRASRYFGLPPFARRSPALRASFALHFGSSTAGEQHSEDHAQEQDDKVIHREPPSPSDHPRSAFPAALLRLRSRIAVAAKQLGLLGPGRCSDRHMSHA